MQPQPAAKQKQPPPVQQNLPRPANPWLNGDSAAARLGGGPAATPAAAQAPAPGPQQASQQRTPTSAAAGPGPAASQRPQQQQQAQWPANPVSGPPQPVVVAANVAGPPQATVVSPTGQVPINPPILSPTHMAYPSPPAGYQPPAGTFPNGLPPAKQQPQPPQQQQPPQAPQQQQTFNPAFPNYAVPGQQVDAPMSAAHPVAGTTNAQPSQQQGMRPVHHYRSGTGQQPGIGNPAAMAKGMAPGFRQGQMDRQFYLSQQYNPSYMQGYPPQAMNQYPHQQPSPQAQGRQAPAPRPKSVLKIVDPDTKEIVNQDHIDSANREKDESSKSSKSTTPAATPETRAAPPEASPPPPPAAKLSDSGNAAKSDVVENSAPISNAPEPSVVETSGGGEKLSDESAPTSNETAGSIVPTTTDVEVSAKAVEVDAGDDGAKAVAKSSRDPLPDRAAEPAKEPLDKLVTKSGDEVSAESNKTSEGKVPADDSAEKGEIADDGDKTSQDAESDQPPTKPSRILPEDARKQYEPEFILSLKPFFEQTVPRYANTPDIGKSGSRTQTQGRPGRPKMDGPGAIPTGTDVNWQRPSKPVSRPPRSGPGPRGGDQGPMGGMWDRGTMVQAPPPMPEVKPLVASENAWKPAKEEADPVAVKIKNVRAILNKLTIEKFDRLYQQILDLGVDEKEVMTGVVTEIFEKAVLEPNFSGMYANLCNRLNRDTLENAGSTDKPDYLFRSILLTQCREEFQRSAASDNLEEFKKKLIEEKGELTADEVQEELTKAKRRMLGNITFIGELFLKGLIVQRILRRECILRLLNLAEEKKEEDVIESLSKLITTVGQKIDGTDKNGNFRAEWTISTDQVFARIRAIGQDQSLPSRVRFMLEGLRELRANNWVGRQKKVEAKTIAEIHADIQKAEAAKAVQSMDNRSSRGGMGRDRRSVAMAPPPSMTMHDGSTRSGASRSESQYDRLSRQGTRPTKSVNNVTLGPQSGFSWGNHAKGASSGRFTSKEVSGPPGKTATPASQDVRPAPEKPKMSEEVVDRKVKSLLEEADHLKDWTSALEDAKEFEGNYPAFVTGLLRYGVEGKPATHKHIAEAMKQTSEAKLLTSTHLREGFVEFMKCLDDFDSPLKGDCVGYCLGRIASLGLLGPESDTTRGLGFLEQALTDVYDPSTIMKMIVSLFTEFAAGLSDEENEEKHKKVRSVFLATNLKLRDVARQVSFSRPEAGEEKLLALLEGNTITYLVPSLQFEKDLAKKLKEQITAADLLKWTRDQIAVPDCRETVIKAVLRENVEGDGSAKSEKEGTAMNEILVPVCKDLASTDEEKLGCLKACETFCESLKFPARGNDDDDSQENPALIVSIFAGLLEAGAVGTALLTRWQSSANEIARSQTSEWLAKHVE